MPGLQQREAVAAVPVLEGHPVEEPGEEDDHRRLPDDVPLEHARRDLAADILVAQQPQFAERGVEVVEPGAKAGHLVGGDVQLQRVQAATGRHRPEAPQAAGHLRGAGDPVRVVQDTGQVMELDRPGRERAHTGAAEHDLADRRGQRRERLRQRHRGKRGVRQRLPQRPHPLRDGLVGQAQMLAAHLGVLVEDAPQLVVLPGRGTAQGRPQLAAGHFSCSPSGAWRVPGIPVMGRGGGPDCPPARACAPDTRDARGPTTAGRRRGRAGGGRGAAGGIRGSPRAPR